MDLNDDFCHRFVTFSSDAKRHIRELGNNIPRLSSILTGIQIFLSKSAHHGRIIHRNPDVYLYVTKKCPDAPAIECNYIFDGNKVEVWGIYVSDEP